MLNMCGQLLYPIKISAGPWNAECKTMKAFEIGRSLVSGYSFVQSKPKIYMFNAMNNNKLRLLPSCDTFTAKK